MIRLDTKTEFICVQLTGAGPKPSGDRKLHRVLGCSSSDSSSSSCSVEARGIGIQAVTGGWASGEDLAQGVRARAGWAGSPGGLQGKHKVSPEHRLLSQSKSRLNRRWGHIKMTCPFGARGSNQWCWPPAAVLPRPAGFYLWWVGQQEAEFGPTVKGVGGRGFLSYSLLWAESPAMGVTPPLLLPHLGHGASTPAGWPWPSGSPLCFSIPCDLAAFICCLSPSCLTILVVFLRSSIICVTHFLN